MPTVQTPEGFLSECQRRGIKLTAKEGTIKATGKPPANPEKFAAFLRSKKPALLEILSASPLPAGNTLPAGEALATLAPLEPVTEAWSSLDLLDILQTAKALLKEGRLSSHPWQKSQGVSVLDPARWLALRLDQVVSIRRSISSADDPLGDAWARTRYGRRIAEELVEFALWYGSGVLLAGGSVEGDFAQSCGPSCAHAREREMP